MDRVAVFVDAGYVFAQGSALLAGKRLTRGEIALDHLAAIKAFAEFAERVSGVQLLRVYWYDGTSTGPTAQHLTLAHLDGVKVRLGFVNSVGEQKGVDSLIVTDMITLARNRAVTDAVLVSGDEDLRVGVQQAQEFGVRVHLVGIKPSRGNQSLFLLQEADTTNEWTDAEVSGFLACKPKPGIDVPEPIPLAGAAVRAGASTIEPDSLAPLAMRVAASLARAEVATLVEAFDRTRQLPKDIDRQLLSGGRVALKRDLDPGEKKRLRALFIDLSRRRLSE